MATCDRLYGAVINVNLQLAQVYRHVNSLGLAIAESKTEAVLFCEKMPDRLSSIRVGVSSIPLDKSMKYLGVIMQPMEL